MLHIHLLRQDTIHPTLFQKYLALLTSSYIQLDTATCILQNCKTEISIQNFIQLRMVSFVYFILLAWRWTSEVETCCEIKDITFTSCVEGSLFPSLLYLTQRDDKRTNRGTYWAWSGCRAGVGVQLLRTPRTPLRWLHPPASCVSMHERVCNRTEAGCEVDLQRGDCEVHVPRETSTCNAGVSRVKIRFAGVRAWWPLHTEKLATARGTHRMRVARCSVYLQRYQLASWCLRTSCVHHSTSWDASYHPASHKSLGHLRAQNPSFNYRIQPATRKLPWAQ